MIHIAYDKELPFIEAILAPFQPYCTLAGFTGTAPEVRAITGADIMIIRSITPVPASLIPECSPQLIITATAGLDHIDQAFMTQRNIILKDTHGSNARAVTEYVLTVFFTFLNQTQKHINDVKVAVIGCGHIGSRVTTALQNLGVKVLPYDPPLKTRLANTQSQPSTPEGTQSLKFTPLADFSALREADFITLHVPLTRTGPHPTHHLINSETLKTFTKTPWLVNTSRGDVCDEQALIAASTNHSAPHTAPRLNALVLDVWENEPTPNPDLLALAAFATPHIAGYSEEAAVKSALKIYEHLSTFLSPQIAVPLLPVALPCPAPTPGNVWNPILNQLEPLPSPDSHPLFSHREIITYLTQLSQQTTFLPILTQQLKATINTNRATSTFETLRKTMRQRREWSALSLLTTNPHPSALIQFLETCQFQWINH